MFNKDNQCVKLIEPSKREIEAIKAVYKGEATPGQQRQCLVTIVNKLSRAKDLLYIPGSFDETAFLNGRAFVGLKVLKYINLPPGKLKEKAEDDVKT